MVGLPIPKEITEALKGTAQMQSDISEIRVLLTRLVELGEMIRLGVIPLMTSQSDYLEPEVAQLPGPGYPELGG